MKIAQIVSTFPPYHGGMGNVAYQIADKLSSLKYEVTVFTPRRSYFEKNLISFFNVNRMVSVFRYGNSAVVLQLFWKLWKFEIIHLHYPFIGACSPIILLKLIKGKKIKFIFHYHMDLVGQGWKSLFYKFYNLLYLSLMIKLADKIIVTSFDYLKESLLAKYQHKYYKKIVEIPNGVDTTFFKPLPKDISLEYKYDLTNKKVVLFVGGLDSSHYFKGVNYLLKAIHLLKRKDIVLILVGDGDLKEVYSDLAESFNINDQVIFTGYVPDQELIKYYNLCDVFILPSIDKSEAFGMVLIEAMACGKPVIASDLPGVRQVINKGVDGRLTRAKDAEHLAEQILYFLNHLPEIEEYGQAGRKKVVTKYSWQIIVKQLIKLYKD